MGSPPRVRGKHVRTSSDGIYEGITPACAGKTLSSSAASRFSRDHPRVCGENDFTIFSNDEGKGSPPRVRGKRGDTKEKHGCPGITPACAGKTCLHMRFGMIMRDHPRVCGENKWGQ